MELFFTGVLSLGSLLYFFRVAQASGERSKSVSVLQPYGAADATLATMLVLFFLTPIVGSANRVVVVNTKLLLVGAMFSFLLTAFVLCFLILRGRNPVALFALSGISWKHNLRGAFYGLAAALPIIYFIHTLNSRLIGEEVRPQPLLEFLAKHADLHDKLLLILTAIVLAPISEELIFRGYIFGVLRAYAGRWWAIIISALVFAAIHAHLPSFAGLFTLAVALTLVYENAGSLWASIFMHALFNGVTVIVTLAWRIL